MRVGTYMEPHMSTTDASTDSLVRIAEVDKVAPVWQNVRRRISERHHACLELRNGFLFQGTRLPLSLGLEKDGERVCAASV